VSAGRAEAVDGHDPHHLRVRVTSSAPTRLLLRQFAFPGWSVRIDGEDVGADVLREGRRADGLMTVPVPACPDGCLVEARYAGPPGARWLWWPALVAVVGFVGVVAWSDRRVRRPIPHPPS
jgi:hypothetical protein